MKLKHRDEVGYTALGFAPAAEMLFRDPSAFGRRSSLMFGCVTDANGVKLAAADGRFKLAVKIKFTERSSVRRPLVGTSVKIPGVKSGTSVKFHLWFFYQICQCSNRQLQPDTVQK